MKNNFSNSDKDFGAPVRRSRFNISTNRVTPAIPPEFARAPRPARTAHPKGPRPDKNGPLIFNVATLLREPEGSHRDYDYEQARLSLTEVVGEKPAEATNIEGHIRLTKVRQDVLAQGLGQADVILECVRCLTDYEQALEFELEDVYHPTIDLISGLPAAAETPEEEAELKLDDNHLLNLGEAIRQQILVSIPISPLCREDCPGLLADLERVNESSTLPDLEEAEAEEEEPIVVDKRWAALSQLLEKGGDN